MPKRRINTSRNPEQDELSLTPYLDEYVAPSGWAEIPMKIPYCRTCHYDVDLVGSNIHYCSVCRCEVDAAYRDADSE